MSKSPQTVAFTLALLAGPGLAQCPDWRAGFDLPGYPVPISALARHDDGSGAKLYAATRITVGTVSGPGMVRWEGDRWSPIGAPFASQGIGSFATFDDGTGPALYAGGTLTTVGGAALGVAKWNGTSWSGLGSGIDGQVYALQVFDDGSGPALYVGGFFAAAGGVPSIGIARWNGTDWSNVGGGLHAGGVQALAVFDDGTGPALFLGGGLELPGGAFAQVARWNGTAFAGVGNPAAEVDIGVISTLGIHDDGSGPALHAGGYTSAPIDSPMPSNVARWNGSAWIPLGNGTGGTIRAFTTFDAGSGPELYACGSSIATSGLIDSNVARWDGQAWHAVGNLAGGTSVAALLVFDHGTGPELHAAGFFHASGLFGSPGSTAVFHIARWNGTGWSWPGQGFFSGSEKLATFDSGSGPELYATTIHNAGSNSTDLLVRWTGNLWSSVGARPNDYVRALQVYDDGSGPALYAGGLFTQVGSQAMSYIARWNGSSWSDVGGGMNLHVYALAVHDDGNGPELIAAGKFTFAGGVPASGVARWNGTSWAAIGGGIPTPVGGQAPFVLASVPGPLGGATLYAGGNFLQSSGAPATHLARWDGSIWQPVGAAPNNRVLALEVVDEGAAGHVLYVGGQFTQIGALVVNRIARWNGASWSALGAGVGAFNPDLVNDIAWFDDGGGPRLHVAGALRRPGDLVPQGLQSWNGTSWSVGAEPVDGYGNGLLVVDEPDGSESLVVSGGFWNAGDVPSYGFAWRKGCPPPITGFCSGDGVDPFVVNDCPCANFGGPGRGCAWSANPQGAVLATSGAQNPDTLVLLASGMPAVAPQTVFWKGDAHLVGAVPWGDGVRCIDGALIRLGTKTNVGGAAQYPEAGNASISVRGQTPPGSGMIAYYQTSFRNAALFCTPNTFNATNGVQVVW